MPGSIAGVRSSVDRRRARMSESDWLWIWIGAAVGLAFLELVTPFLFFMISFAAGAALAAVAALLDASVALQWGVFVLGSAAALLVLVPDRAAPRRQRERRGPRGRDAAGRPGRRRPRGHPGRHARHRSRPARAPAVERRDRRRRRDRQGHRGGGHRRAGDPPRRGARPSARREGIGTWLRSSSWLQWRCCCSSPR